jgi:anti-sigma factor RsiW
MKDKLRTISCVDEETMACYIDGLLLEKEIKQVAKHIAICDKCKKIVGISKKIKHQEDTSNFEE